MIYTTTTITTAKTIDGLTVTVPAGAIIHTSAVCLPADQPEAYDHGAENAQKADFPLFVHGITGAEARPLATLTALHKEACEKYANTRLFAIVCPELCYYSLFTRIPSSLLRFSTTSGTGTDCIRTTDYSMRAFLTASREAVAEKTITTELKEKVAETAYAAGFDVWRRLTGGSGWRGRLAEALVAANEGVPLEEAVCHAAFDNTDTRIQPDIPHLGIEVKYKNATICTLHG